MFEKKPDHTPRINKVSKALVREGKSWERLYHEAEEKKRREEREKEFFESLLQFDPNTGKPLFSPDTTEGSQLFHSNYNSGSGRSNGDGSNGEKSHSSRRRDVVDSLLSRGLEIEQKKEKMRSTPDPDLVFSPQLTKISPTMKKKVEERRKQTKLYKPKDPYVPKASSSLGGSFNDFEPRSISVQEFLNRNMANVSWMPFIVL